jgi:hypothetical protein
VTAASDQDQQKPIIFPVNAAHMMRTTQLAQLQLSAMADTKASILMGATFVIFTITINQAHSGNAPLPLLILGAAAFFSAIFAVLAVLPMIKRRPPADGGNLLFFGHFTAMGEDEFVKEITGRLTTETSIYRTMARDIYQNGMVLQHKKYRMLGFAYRILLLGMVGSSIAFVIPYFK